MLDRRCCSLYVGPSDEISLCMFTAMSYETAGDTAFCRLAKMAKPRTEVIVNDCVYSIRIDEPKVAQLIAIGLQYIRFRRKDIISTQLTFTLNAL